MGKSENVRKREGKKANTMGKTEVLTAINGWVSEWDFSHLLEQ